MYDVIVIGTGPAGYTAALYCARYNMDVLQIGKKPGGLISEAPDVCNYPGFENIRGMELSNKMEKQVKELDVEVVYDEVVNIDGKDLSFEVEAKRDSYRTKKIILATGQERRKLGLEREGELSGRGISYCATCDGPLFGGKNVGVVGGGDAALASALLLAEHAEQVYIFYRQDEFFRPEPVRIEEVELEENILPVFEVNVDELIGEEKLEAVKLDNDEVYEIEGLFIEIGSIPNSELAEELGIETTENSYVKTDEERRTDVPGIYAAGDVIDSPLKQVVTAAGQGAEAAATAYEELKKQESKIN